MADSTFSDTDLEFFRPIIAKCRALVKMVTGVQEYYQSEDLSEHERRHVETTIGAGLWYIRSSGLWTGRISIEALELFLPDSGISKPKWTADHEIPRKVAATELLNFDWTQTDSPQAEMARLYLERFGRVNYVTSTENKKLTKYQKADVFTNPESAYESAGVQLVKISEQKLSAVKSRSASVIRSIIGRSA